VRTLQKKNGTNSAVILSGQSLVHRDLDKRQLACVAADVRDGLAIIQPTTRQLSTILGVSVTYVQVAEKLSPEKRAAIIARRDSTSFSELLNPPERHHALPKPNGGGSAANNANAHLLAVVRKYGVGPVLDACCAIEAAE
jgi:hypothetical protein